MPKSVDPIICDIDPNSITVAQAREFIDGAVVPVGDVESVPVYQARGRVTAEDIHSEFDVPNHTNSAMDGYALNGDDLSDSKDRVCKLVGVSMAGKRFDNKVKTGECVRIMTGAVMPEGTDTVVMQERVAVEGDRVTIPPGQNKASNVRYAGEDIAAGSVAIPAGIRLGASQLGLAASLGLESIRVWRRPRVAFFSNGDELRSVGEPLDLGEVYDSNRYTLHAMLDELDVEQIDLGIVKDDPEAIAEIFLRAAAQSDMVITTAGASVGDADYVKQTLEQLGQVNFWKVAVKPGRPLSFGRVGDALFFGLPGNPVSVMVTFQVFVGPAIRRLGGEKFAVPMVMRVRTQSTLRKRPGRTEYQRGVLSVDASGETVVTSTGEQGSGILSSMATANCYIVLPDDCGGVEAGERVEVQPFDQLG